MTRKEAKQLLIATVVFWEGNPKDLGTVRKLGPGGFYVDWENGQKGWIDYEGAQKVDIRYPLVQKRVGEPEIFMRIVIPSSNPFAALADAIEVSKDGDVIEVDSQEMKELAEDAKERMCPAKQIAFAIGCAEKETSRPAKNAEC